MIRRSKDPADNFTIADESRKEYWIIDLNQMKSYGPYLQREQFDKAVAELHAIDTTVVFRPPPFTRMQE